jgi:hypothetical protein
VLLQYSIVIYFVLCRFHTEFHSLICACCAGFLPVICVCKGRNRPLPFPYSSGCQVRSQDIKFARNTVAMAGSAHFLRPASAKTSKKEGTPTPRSALFVISFIQLPDFLARGGQSGFAACPPIGKLMEPSVEQALCPDFISFPRGTGQLHIIRVIRGFRPFSDTEGRL